jgi:hypothetical protein
MSDEKNNAAPIIKTVTVKAIQIEFEQPIEIDPARLRGIMGNFGYKIGRNIEQQTRYNWNYFAEIPGQEQPADPKGSLKIVKRDGDGDE